MTIGEIPVGHCFTVSALGGQRYTVLMQTPGRDPTSGLTTCSYWNEWGKCAAETTFGSHLTAFPAASPAAPEHPPTNQAPQEVDPAPLAPDEAPGPKEGRTEADR